MNSTNPRMRVLLVEDDKFALSMVTELLEAANYLVATSENVSNALDLLESFDPHVVLTDLYLGVGPGGAELLTHVHKNKPWVGKVAMSVHASPELGVANGSKLPESTIYIVKTEISSKAILLDAISASIENTGSLGQRSSAMEEMITLSSSQAEILKMLADGLSNSAIAEARGITLRATEALIQRTFISLGVSGDSNVNARVAAVRIWQQGSVRVK